MAYEIPPEQITERAMLENERYAKAAHAMQSGVRYDLERHPRVAEPKHVRVGINSALVSSEALAYLLIEKGLITFEELSTATADAMEREVKRYEDRANEGRDGGPVIHFG